MTDDLDEAIGEFLHNAKFRFAFDASLSEWVWGSIHRGRDWPRWRIVGRSMNRRIWVDE